MTRKKVMKKKVTKNRARTKKAKSVFDQLESSFVGTPIRVANKTFLASLGVVATMQTELTKFQSDFEKTFGKLVKDGEKVRNRYRAEFKGFKKDVREFGGDVKEYGEDLVEEVVEAKDKAVENIRSIAA
jgi:hypothetical protein